MTVAVDAVFARSAGVDTSTTVIQPMGASDREYTKTQTEQSVIRPAPELPLGGAKPSPPIARQTTDMIAPPRSTKVRRPTRSTR